MEVKGKALVKYGRKCHTSLHTGRFAHQKKLKKHQKSAFRHATRRKVIQATLEIFVAYKSKYGGKGQNPRKMLAKVLLTLRVSGRKVLVTFRAQIDR